MKLTIDQFKAIKNHRSAKAKMIVLKSIIKTGNKSALQKPKISV